jgi:hypothetical protein
MKSLFEQAIESLLDGISLLSFGSESLDSFVSSVLSESSSFTPTPNFEQASQRFERASTYAYMLFGSHRDKYPLNGQSVLEQLNYLNTLSDVPTKWCKSILESQLASEQDKDLAFSTYDKFVTGVGKLNEVLKKIREGEIKVMWIDGRDPGDLPDITTPVTLNRHV